MENDQISPVPSNKGLIAAIVFATVVVSGSLVFLGLQMNGSNTADTAQMAALLEEYKKAGVNLPPPIPTSQAVIMDNDAVMGNKSAKVTLVEFSDYQCPFCLRHFTETFPLIKKNYIDTGKVKYVFRDFPLDFHANAIPAAMAAECARQQQGDAMYFQMGDKVFANQKKMYDEGDQYPKSLAVFASELGLNSSKFSTCMSDPNTEAEVFADNEAGSSFGVTGTPGFIINDGTKSQLIKGAQPYSAFTKVLDQMLK